MTLQIVGIRFQRVGKIYHFEASAIPDIKVGDFVIVDTQRGRQLGEVVQLVNDPPPPPEGSWKPIRRRASARDLVMRQSWQKQEAEATAQCRTRLAELRVAGVKIVDAEYSFDGMRLTFIYSTESEEKIDLKHLRSIMQRKYPQTKVEMHQVGPRDVAKLLGGMGACGIENRCCSRHLTDFNPISIKMAKEQGISLAPPEITGMCGRLRCCLVYEYDHYVEARKSLPKRNKRVITPQGEGKIIDVLPLKSSVIVELDSGTQAEFASTDLQPWDETESLRRKNLGDGEPLSEAGAAPGEGSAEAPSTSDEDLEAGEIEAPSPLPAPKKPLREAPRGPRPQPPAGGRGPQSRPAKGGEPKAPSVPFRPKKRPDGKPKPQQKPPPGEKPDFRKQGGGEKPHKPKGNEPA